MYRASQDLSSASSVARGTSEALASAVVNGRVDAWSNLTRTLAIHISFLNAVLQIALQVVLLVMTTNAYQNLPILLCIEDFIRRQTSDLVLRWETAPIIPLHLLALSLHIMAVKHSSTSLVPFLLILFGLSFASSVIQLVHIFLQCMSQVCGMCSATTGIIPIAISRACLSLLAFVVLLLWTIYRLPSFIKEFMTKSILATIVFLVSQTIAIAIKGGTDSPFFYLWLASTIVAVIAAVGIAIFRHHRNKSNLLTTTEDSPTFENPGSGEDVPASQTLSSTNAAPLDLSDSTAHLGGSFDSRGSSASLGVRTSIPSVSRRRTDLGGAQIGQSSIDTEALPAAVHSRLSIGNAPTNEASQPIPLFPNRYTTLPPSEGAHATHLVPSHGATQNLFGDENQSSPTPRLRESSAALFHSRLVSTRSSTPTVPPYTYDPYSYRPIRSNTITTNGTDDTLPSYRTRRSSHTPPGTLATRFLPPPPSLPLASSGLISPAPPNYSSVTAGDRTAGSIDG